MKEKTYHIYTKILSILMIIISVNGISHASITGLTTTNDNGVERVTNNQDIANGTINGETIILDGGTSRLRATGNPGLVIQNSHIKLDSDVTTANDNDAPLTYGARANTTNRVTIQDNSTILAGPFTGRRNIFISELSGKSSIIESENSKELFVYTQQDAILNSCTLRGIRVWEIYRSPSIAFDITVEDAQNGYLNWEAGRLDFIGFKTSNIERGSIWIGQGNGGNNQSYHWNNDPSFDNTRFYLTDGNNRYYEGYTASWEFLDKTTFLPLNDTLIIYTDNRSGSDVELTRYTTNTSGRMVGTYDSQLETTGASIERPTLFIRTNQVTTVLANGAATYPIATIAGDQGDRFQNYDLDSVIPKVEVRSYLHEAPSGFSLGDTFSITEELGQIKSDGSIETYSPFLLTPDTNITETSKTTVLAYSSIDTLDQLYDRAKAAWRENDGYPLLSVTANTIDFGDYSLVIDKTAVTAFDVNTVSKIITIKSDVLSEGALFNAVATTGTISLVNGGLIDVIYSDANSDSAVLIDTTFPAQTVTLYSNLTDLNNSTNPITTLVSNAQNQVVYRYNANPGNFIYIKTDLGPSISRGSMKKYELLTTTYNTLNLSAGGDFTYVNLQLRQIKGAGFESSVHGLKASFNSGALTLTQTDKDSIADITKTKIEEASGVLQQILDALNDIITRIVSVKNDTTQIN